METAAEGGRGGFGHEKIERVKKKEKKGVPASNHGRWSALGVGCGGVGCVEARREASTRYEWSDLIGLQSTPFILMCRIFWVAFFSSHSLVLSAGDRSQVDVAKFSSIPWWMYIYTVLA